MTPGNVFRHVEPLTETEFRRFTAAGVAQLAAVHDVERLAFRMGCCTKTIENAAATRTTLRADLLLNAVLAGAGCFSALWQRLEWEPAARNTAPVPDIDMLAELSALLAQYADAMRDGRICHRETLALAARIRTLVPGLNNILAAADRLAAAT